MNIIITVYGAEEKCASCVNLPSALDTKEWLEAAINRKYTSIPVTIRYVDIYKPETEEDKKYSEEILDDVYFYPLIVIDDEVVAEGNPKLKDIFAVIEEKGKGLD
ncbi:YuzD family protein [Bacillus sp. FJAT-45350]|uniref:YuzD family protein n=1 Tax=Bacillus sp. FJAT-45350 TaxID=2011014 RepID=UPI000BB794F9|nr:YuzD family protein [Bacillus sp. FJAT-45350]